MKGTCVADILSMNYYPKDEIETEILSRRKSAPSLYNISQDFVLKYTIQVILRQVGQYGIQTASTS